MICWHCSRILSKVDISQSCEAEGLKQTEYTCTNCGAVYVVGVHEIHGPTKQLFDTNVAHP